MFCCAHAAQIEAYLESSKWTSVPNFAVHTIVSTDCVSVGEVRITNHCSGRFLAIVKFAAKAWKRVMARESGVVAHVNEVSQHACVL